jgi:hypothetical protein
MLFERKYRLHIDYVLHLAITVFLDFWTTRRYVAMAPFSDLDEYVTCLLSFLYFPDFPLFPLN